MALITLANAKTYLGISGSDKDAVLNLLIEQGSSIFELLTGRKFDSETYTDKEYDGSGNRELVLDHRPIITFTKLEKRNTLDNSDNWSTIDSDKYWVDTDNGIITKTTNFLDWDIVHRDPEIGEDITFEIGKRNYRATYTAGYSTIPNDVQSAVMQMVGFMYNTRSKGGYESETLGDRTLRLSNNNTITSGFVGSVINKYKEPIL